MIATILTNERRFEEIGILRRVLIQIGLGDEKNVGETSPVAEICRKNIITKEKKRSRGNAV